MSRTRRWFNPYIGSKTQNPFGTMRGPDMAGILAEMATCALKASWFHKWMVDMRLRPEEYGALVHANLTHASPMPQAAAALYPEVPELRRASWVLQLVLQYAQPYAKTYVTPGRCLGHAKHDLAV